MLPLIGTVLLSAIGQLGVKLATDIGKKLFGSQATSASSAEDFSTQLKRQVDKAGAPTETLNGPLALAQFQPGLQIPPGQGLSAGAQEVTAVVDASLPIGEAVEAYRKFEAAWPGRSVSLRVISPQQAP